MAEHVGLLRSSKSEFIQELFAESDAELAEAAAIAGGKVRRGTKSAFKLNSVGAQFRKQLQVIYCSGIKLLIYVEFCYTSVLGCNLTLGTVHKLLGHSQN